MLNLEIIDSCVHIHAFDCLHLRGRPFAVTSTNITLNDTVIERGKAENDWWFLRVGQHDGDE